MRNRIALAVVLVCLSAAASGDGIDNPATGGNGNWVGRLEGINNSGIGGSAIPATPCNAGQLDFSDATGCNLTLLMVGL